MSVFFSNINAKQEVKMLNSLFFGWCVWDVYLIEFRETFTVGININIVLHIF